MDWNEALGESLYFGMVLSLLAYRAGCLIQQRGKKAFLNPLLIAIVLVMGFLSLTGISYETYQYGAKYLGYFLTPATICLAVPLYRQFQALKDNLAAILVSIGIGCFVHAAVAVGILAAFSLEKEMILSVMAKSITSAIALGVVEEIGGIAGIAVFGINIAGISGAALGPALLKLFGITEPVAQGLALGSASHATGTSKAIELGEVQAAMSSLAIVVTGLMTVAIVPWLASFFP